MSRSAQQAVNDYLSSMFSDTLEESLSDAVDKVVEIPVQPQDSIPAEYRLSIGVDAFALLNGEADPMFVRYLTYLNILNLACQLPQGRIKRYCLSHCQMLLAQGAVYE